MLIFLLGLFGCSEPPNPAAFKEEIEKAFSDETLAGVSALIIPGKPAERTFSLIPGPGNTGSYNEKTKFRIASLTKVFTQLAVLKLAEQTLIDLDAPLKTYRPEFKAAWAEEVTIRQLLAFTSGLPLERNETPEASGVTFDDRGFALSELDGWKDPGPETTPGKKVGYSNLGYYHLGAVIEAVTGKPFGEAIQDLIVHPLGLTETGFGDGNFEKGDFAKGYKKSETGQATALPFLELATRYSSGGMFSSLRDLERLSNAILSGQLLDSKSLEEFQNQFGRLQNTKTLPLFGHVPGYSAALYFDFENRFSVIILNNLIGQNPEEIKNVLYRSVAAFSGHSAKPAVTEPPGEGWSEISSPGDLPDNPQTSLMRSLYEGFSSGEEVLAFRALVAFFGFEGPTLDEKTRAEVTIDATNETRMFREFGPFQITAWRITETEYELFLRGPENRALILAGIFRKDGDRTKFAGLRKATYGFRPNVE